MKSDPFRPMQIGKGNALLHSIVTALPEDFKPFGMRTRQGHPDYSNGCRHLFRMMPREGEQMTEWGVCGNPASYRRGLLTNEHQGCDKFQGQTEGKRDLYHTRQKARVTLP